MLNSAAWLLQHRQAASRGVRLLRLKPLSTMLTIFVIAMTLALPLLFWILMDNLNYLTQNWQKSGQISLYLKMDLSEAEQNKLLQQIRQLPEVKQASLRTAAQGLAELSQQEGMEDLMRYLPENPLPAVIEVLPAARLDATAQLELLTKQLENLPLVAQAKLDLGWMKRLHLISGFAASLTKALMGLLILAVLFIIANTLGSALLQQREEIQLLKLIGARESFILRPFLYSGICYGLLGVLLSLVVVHCFIFSLENLVNQLASAYQMSYKILTLSFRQILLLLFLTILLGWIGAYTSIKRQLMRLEP